MKKGLKINFNYIKITYLNMTGFKYCKLIIERLIKIHLPKLDYRHHYLSSIADSNNFLS